MTYFEFIDDIIENFRVSKMIEIVKVEQDLDNNDLLAVAYEATRSLIIVANYSDRPDMDMPQVQGFSQLDFMKQIINIGKNADTTSVKFKETDEGIASDTIFKMNNMTTKIKNVPKALLPDTPKNLSNFVPDFEITFTPENIAEVMVNLSLNIFNASVYLTKSSKGKLSFRLTNDVDDSLIETSFDVPEEKLNTPFKIDLERLIAIFRVANKGVSIAVDEQRNLMRLIKENDTAKYQYFLIKKAA